MNHFLHPGCNFVFNAPEGWADDPTNIPCDALPVERTYVQGLKSTPCIVSYWRPTAEELAFLNNGGHVALSILGHGMAPVILEIQPKETKMQMMKIMGAETLKEIPMLMLLAHEKQAILNHGQSLHRLNERGGLGCCEVLAIIEGRGWGQVNVMPDDEERLTTLVQKWSEV